jgi:hypothetical protein
VFSPPFSHILLSTLCSSLQLSPTFSLQIQHGLHTGSGALSASYTRGTGGFVPGVNRPGREAHHSTPPNASTPVLPIHKFIASTKQLCLSL